MPRGVKYATEEERLAARRANRAKYRSDPEKRAKEQARDKRWREANPEKVRAGQRAWRALNAEKVAADHRAWREANPEKARESSRKGSARWRERNPQAERERKHRWARENKDYFAEFAQRRRATIRDNDPDFTVEQWHAILAEFNQLCAYCGEAKKLERDHVIPVSRGGRHTASNIVPACRSCNASKGDRLLAEWRGLV